MEPHAFIDALLRPEAYPDRPDHVSMRQTHISWLFFTERFVYKVKKPVNFGFLDFTTLEARQFFCQAEVRLNRRLAPGVYLGVVDVKAEDGLMHFGGSGVTIDYAVQMRRLPEDRMLPALLAKGEVAGDTMRHLARLIADFHAQADTGGDIDRDGSLDVILANWQENFAQTRPYLGFPLSQEAYDTIQTRVLNFCRLRASLFTQRVAAGRIRDGHGDLRAEHICLTEPVAIFDCIEFNHRFRHGDVAADVAFLAMDLDERGHPELARAFVEAYVGYSGDRGLLDVLDFYKCYRAFVRAKVECFRLDDPTVSAAEKRTALRAAQRYGQLAARYAEALQRPWLLVCCGLMGTGKSVLAEALARRLDVTVLSSDATRKQLAGLAATAPARDEFGAGIYTAEWTEATYAQLFQEAERRLLQGRSVLLDASFQRACYRLRALQMAQRIGVEFCVLECWCPEEEIRRRLEGRAAQGGAVSDGRWDLVGQQRQAFEPLFDVPPRHHLRVDTTPPPERVADDVIRELARRAPLPWPTSAGAEA
jgi:aminoglycoside phosphotransferase family enzyme/predicted kinase